MTRVGVLAHAKKHTGGGLEALRAALAEHGVGDPEWREVRKSRKAPEQVKELIDAGVDLLVVWGGDGTVQRCLDTVVRAGAADRVTLAIVPAGTANLLATNLGLPTGVREAVDVALHGRRRAVDVGTVNGEHFAVMAGVGFDALLMRDTGGALKRRFGRLAYVWTGARNLRAASARVRVEVDGGLWFVGRAGCVLVGNVGTLIGGLEAFPDARIDSGHLEVGVVEATTATQWLRVLTRTALSRAERSPLVRTTTATALHVTLDRALPYELDGGDRDRTSELQITLHPAAVTLCVPPGAEV